MSERSPCLVCGDSIHPDTAAKNDGVCTPCKGDYKKHQDEIDAAKFSEKERAWYRQSAESRYWRHLVDRADKDISQLNRIERTYFCVRLFDAEVNNGGFHQFFSNSSGDYFSETMSALYKIDAIDTFMSLHMAKEILFEDSAVPIDRDERQKLLGHTYSEDKYENDDVIIDNDDPLTWLDRDYYEDKDEIAKKLEDYARVNNLFTSDEYILINEQTTVLTSFIKDEAIALRLGIQGVFYPSNHHLIHPLAAKAGELLSSDERIELYFHLLRLVSFTKISTEAELVLLLKAYQRLLPLFEKGYPQCTLPRTAGLFIFSFDDRGFVLDDTPSLEEHIENKKLWSSLNVYWSYKGIFKKKDKFKVWASDEQLCERILKILRHIKYAHEAPLFTCTWFWALIFILLLNKKYTALVVADFLNPENLVADFQDTLKILNESLLAADETDLAKTIELHIKAQTGIVQG
jgi:hypothetical protein